MVLSYGINEIRPFINWIYFDYAWSMNGKKGEERDRLHADANAMLDIWQEHNKTHAVFEIMEANSDGDDIIVKGLRLPMLRQQHATEEHNTPQSGHGCENTPADKACNLCLADFVRPLSQNIADKVGAFATTVDPALTTGYENDPYNRMLSQVLADRLAEATAEKTHLDIRKKYWGYAPDECLSMKDIHAGHYQGIRPAVGYPSMPDTSLNFMLERLIGMSKIGISLTTSGMMCPHASVSGLMFAHPKACYFDVGKIGEDQLRDYAKRRGLPIEISRKFLASSLLKK